LSAIEDASVRVYVVWVPILPTDRGTPSQETRGLVHDERAAHFWDAKGVLPGLFQSTLDLRPGIPAWDVYMIYPPGIWWQKTPPKPAYWEHQLGVTNAPRLNGRTFAAHLRKVLRLRQQGELETPVHHLAHSDSQMRKDLELRTRVAVSLHTSSKSPKRSRRLVASRAGR
jgi:hypothetical protein